MFTSNVKLHRISVTLDDFEGDLARTRATAAVSNPRQIGSPTVAEPRQPAQPCDPSEPRQPEPEYPTTWLEPLLNGGRQAAMVVTWTEGDLILQEVGVVYPQLD